MQRNDRLRQFPLLFVEDLQDPTLRDEDVRHLVGSLRRTAGDQVNVGDGAGRWIAAELTSEDGELRIVGSEISEPLGVPPISVGFAPTKGVKAERVVQQLVEIGVDEIVVLQSARSVVNYDGQRSERLLRKLNLTAREACQQSRQPWLPRVAGVLSLAEFCESRRDALLCDPSGPPLWNRVLPASSPLSVAVGPEGGWSDAETVLAPAVSLPGRILRSETAAVAAGVVAAALRESVGVGKEIT